VATYTSSTINPAVIRHYIPLYAEPVTMSISNMSAFCRERYKSVLSDQLLNVSRSVNYQLCTKSLCSYMSGTPGGGASIGASSSSFGTREMYVAVDTSAVSSAVTLQYNTTTATGQYFAFCAQFLTNDVLLTALLIGDAVVLITSSSPQQLLNTVLNWNSYRDRREDPGFIEISGNVDEVANLHCSGKPSLVPRRNSNNA